MPPRFLVPLYLAALLAGGCATVFHGSHQGVPVFSDPPAARVEVDGVTAGQTPLSVRLRRGKAHVLQVSKPGYEERTLTIDSRINGGWIILDVLCGLLPLVVDGATSNWESYERSLNFHLPKIPNATVPAAATEFAAPTTGVLLMVDRQLVAFPLDGGTVYAKIQIGWHEKNVELSLGDGLHVGSSALGPYDKDRIVLRKGSRAYVMTPRGRIVHIRVTSLNHEAVEMEWIDQNHEAMPAVMIEQPAPVAVPAPPDSTAALGGMLSLRSDEPVEFPVDGGVITAKIHRNDVELRFGEGLHVGYTAAGPHSADRITLAPGMDAYVLTRSGRLVHVRCTSLESGEAVIDWRRK